MKVELRSIKVHMGLSEETPAYTARVYVDGEHVLDVKNEGHGGPDYQYPSRTLNEKLGMPPKTVNHRKVAEYVETLNGGKFMGFETLCHGLVWDHVERRNLKSRLSKSVMVTKDGEVYKVGRGKSQAILDHATKTYGADSVLNVMDFDRAFKIWKGTAS